MSDSDHNRAESSSDRDLIRAARADAADAASASIEPEGLLDLPADAIPGYTLVREIHRGGQGVIYLAIQQSTKRKVAIKVLHEGPFAGRRDRARFEREVEILASLNHPNVVVVHDSGRAAGQFYFVMDYIRGRTLDAAGSSDRRVDETLGLFLSICRAVSAAHLHGVIHRDLKPGNIIIDAQGQPHVVDFGLAKVALGDMTDASEPQLMTLTGQFVGSLPWASPEQAAGAPDQVDVRSDVYSLGVILYQMLTGRFPYEVAGNMRDVLDNILRTEPARPSTIRRKIDNEVETIVLKCLSKERDRRYQSAAELAQDVARYLAGEAIQAKRDSGWYVLRTWARRHRAQATALVSIAMLVLAFGIVTGLMTRHLARVNVDLAGQRQAAEAAAVEARTQAARADRVQEFLADLLASPDPAWGLGRDVLVAQVLDRAAARVGSELKGEPEVEAAVRSALGRAYFALGMPDRAEPQYRRCLQLREQHLGPSHPDTLNTKQNLAVLLRNTGRLAEAQGLYRQAIDGLLERFGPDSPRPYRRMMNLARLVELTDPPAAEEVYQRALDGLERALGDAHPDVLLCRNHYGLYLLKRGRLEQAGPLLESTLAAFEERFGVHHAVTAIARYKVARLRAAQSRPVEAEALFTQAIEDLQAAKGPTHPDTLGVRHQLARFLLDGGRAGQAAGLWRDIVAVADSTTPPRRELPVYRSWLGRALMETGESAEAEAELLAARAALVEQRGAGDKATIAATRFLIDLYDRAQRPREADRYRAMIPPRDSEGSPPGGG